MWPDLDAQLARLMKQFIPLEDGKSWHVHTVSDNALISRYPIRWQGGELAVSYPLPQLDLPRFHYGFASAVVDLPERFGDTDLLAAALHNKSGAAAEYVRLRQMHSDASMQPFKTLLSGNIIDEEMFGPDFRIDWDGTDMADVRPSHNGLDREYYTWRNDNMQFKPSALDRIIFTDSVMSVRRRFVLNTMTMSADDLATLGLQQSDVLYGGDPNYYDHLPLVADFAIDSASLEEESL